MSDRCRGEFERWLREAFELEVSIGKRQLLWIAWQAAWEARDRGRFKTAPLTFERAAEFNRAMETE